LEEKTYYSEYQPIVRLSDGEIFAYEALARFWYEDDYIKPDELFKGLYPEPETLCVLESALKRFQFQHAPESFPLFINLDPHSAVFNMDRLDETILPFERDGGVIFELIDDPFRIDDADRETLISYFKDRDIKLAIDNYGKKEKSFSMYMIEIVDYVKFDRLFMKRCITEQNYSTFAKSTIEFVHSLGKKVIVEGVENQSEYDNAVAHGADFVQGYMFKDKFLIVDSW
jgi:EAL domain-containing protein (putative c-di-GMP-specific phosphodiesterase class I)